MTKAKKQLDLKESAHNDSRCMQPLRRAGRKLYSVNDDAVLVPNEGTEVYSLNSTGAEVWKMCDGRHSLMEMHKKLSAKYQGNEVQVMADVATCLMNFRSLDLLEPDSLRDDAISKSGAIMLAPTEDDHPRVHIVLGIEDNNYFQWQLAIMFESLVGQLPAGWEISVVVCNNHLPISTELAHILDTYSVQHYTGESHADNHHIDFAGGGDRYVAMNRIEALNIVSHHVAPDDIVCLMDTDIFLYGDLQKDLFPRNNAMASNWIIGQEKYFQFAANDTKGLDLNGLLNAMGFEQKFKPGGVMIFLTGETLQRNDRKVIRDCFRFLQIHFLAGKILDMPDHGVWVAEMASFAMAMYPSGIDYDLLDIEQFAVQEQHADELPEGTFFHYYTDINDSGSLGPFYHSQWHKQLFRDKNFLKSEIDSFLDIADGKAEKCFMNLAKRSRDRLYGGPDVG